jgi:hypothetical protein
MILALAILFPGVTRQTVRAAIILGGTDNDNLKEALNDLGVPYINQSGNVTPNPAGLGAGDIIVIGNDGGTSPNPPHDYHAFLNAGGDVIIAGGTNWDPWRTWVAGYFNITDTAGGWHRDGDWHSISNHPANRFLPTDYHFVDNNITYHMLGFLATPDSTLLGRNDENVVVAAFRNYPNGGSFNYMALDLGAYDNNNADQAPFITPWLRGALAAAGSIPEPCTLAAALVALGFAAAGRRSLR